MNLRGVAQPVLYVCVRRLTKIKVGRLHGWRTEQRETELLFAYKKGRSQGGALARKRGVATVQFR